MKLLLTARGWTMRGQNKGASPWATLGHLLIRGWYEFLEVSGKPEHRGGFVGRPSRIRAGSLMVREGLALWHAPLTDSRDRCVHKPQRVEKGGTKLVSAFRLGKAHQWCHSTVARHRIEIPHAWRTRYLDPPPLATDCQGTIAGIGLSRSGDGRRKWRVRA